MCILNTKLQVFCPIARKKIQKKSIFNFSLAIFRLAEELELVSVVLFSNRSHMAGSARYCAVSKIVEFILYFVLLQQKQYKIPNTECQHLNGWPVFYLLQGTDRTVHISIALCVL